MHHKGKFHTWNQRIRAAFHKESKTLEIGPQSTMVNVRTTGIAVHGPDGRIRVGMAEEEEIDLHALQEQFSIDDRTEGTKNDATPPVLNVCIMIVGTQGDVQPFLAIALRLQKDGHRVRLATHAIYRDLVTSYDVEFYPLGGDPKELAAYMVKTGGHLIPTKLETLQKDVPRNMKMIEEILHSTWPAVSAADPEGGGPGVRASWCASAYYVSTTVGAHDCVPSPACQCAVHWQSAKEKLSVVQVGGSAHVAGHGRYRERVPHESFGLRKIRKGDGGRDILLTLNIPYAFMWSPALVPKPKDWGNRYDVVGTVALKGTASTYTPSPELEEFLGNGDGPIFIGFGSMVLDDPRATTQMVIEAAEQANTRVLIQSSWSDMAGDLETTENIFFLGNCPHDWLMPRVRAVVHHGGAGTTAAGLLAGKPTFIVPFFGDQHFWGWAVSRAGAGIAPCPIEQLTAEKLCNAFMELQCSKLHNRALEIQQKMQQEDGAEEAVRCFYRHLPIESMYCDLDDERIATKWHPSHKLKLCDVCDFVVASQPENIDKRVMNYHIVDYTARGPSHGFAGASAGTAAFFHELSGAFKDVVVKPAKDFRGDGPIGAVIGVVKGASGLSHESLPCEDGFPESGKIDKTFAVGSKEKDVISEANVEGLRQYSTLQIVKSESIVEKPVETTVPPMNICLATIGTWNSNVKQLVAIGMQMAADGHRVRIAASEEFRNEITERGLEFYPLAGTTKNLHDFIKYLHDTKELSPIQRLQIDRPVVRAFKHLIYSLHPLLVGHVHVAERLGIPLQSLDLMPLSPTCTTPQMPNAYSLDDINPLDFENMNWLSHGAVASVLWRGVKDIVGDFRAHIGLKRYCNQTNALIEWRIPHVYLWSPALLQKPASWRKELFAPGYITLRDERELAKLKTNKCPRSLNAFALAACNRVVYFGVSIYSIASVEIDRLLRIIDKAAEQAEVKIILQTREARPCHVLYRSENVYEVEHSFPYSLILRKVAAIIHWGEPAIMAEGLAASKPLGVCVTLPSQHYSAYMTVSAGVGIPPIDLRTCTVESLTVSLQSILLPEIRHRVQDVAKTFKPMQALEKTVETFYMNLPLRAMRCDLDENKVARIYDPILELKLSFDAYIAIQPLRSHDDSGDVSYKPLFYDGRRPAKYSLRDFACDQELKDAKTTHSIRKALAFFNSPESNDSVPHARRSIVSRPASQVALVTENPTFWSSAQEETADRKAVIADYEKALFRSNTTTHQ
ncbi:unnamed protein product [Phytophthora fragariaefolia]|uniref:Unnamed protein product n=1 Tax=Phytophthora fragariaefolia TaxID=1490495 RepID=A0A9W6X9T2_9STRA|nr:unnamed protein product [Phytophthora fragariaefolia]